MDGARAADLASGDAIRVSGALLQILQAASGGRDMSNFADLVFRKVVVGASSTGNNDTWLSCKRLAYDVLRCSRLRPQLWTKLESTLPGDMANGPPDLRMAALGMAIHVPEARVGEFLRSAARELTICTGPDSPSTVRRAAVVTLSRLLMKEDFLALCENSPWAAETIRSWWGTIAAATLDPDASISEASFTALGDLFSSIDPALSSPSPAARLRDPQARYVCQHLASRLAHSLWFKLDTLLRRADALPLTGRRATAYPLTFLVRAAAAGILGDILSRTPPHPASSSSTSSTSSKGQQSMIERTAHGSSSSLSRSQDRFFHTPAALGKLSRAVSDVASQLAPLLSSLQPSAVHEAAACLLAIASLPGAPVDLGLAAASALLSLWERRDVASGGREAVLSSLARGATSLPPGRQPPLLRRLLLLATHPGAPKSDRPNVLAHVARAAMELRMAACVAVRAGETPPAGTELKDVYGEIVASLQLLRPGLPQQLEPSSASDGPSAVAADGTPLAARARGGAGAGTGSGTGGGGSIISPSYPPPVREELLACLCETAERLMEPPGSLGLRGGANNGVDGGGGGGGEGYGGSGAPPGGMLSAAVLLGGMGYSRRRPAVPYVSAHALVPWPLQGSALRGHLAGRPRADWADAWVLSALELLEAWAPCLAWETAGRVYAIDCYLRLASVLCGAVGVRGAGMGSSSPSPGGSSSMIGSSSTTALNSSGGNAATATSFAWERRAMAAFAAAGAGGSSQVSLCAPPSPAVAAKARARLQGVLQGMLRQCLAIRSTAVIVRGLWLLTHFLDWTGGGGADASGTSDPATPGLGGGAASLVPSASKKHAGGGDSVLAKQLSAAMALLFRHTLQCLGDDEQRASSASSGTGALGAATPGGGAGSRGWGPGGRGDLEGGEGVGRGAGGGTLEAGLENFEAVALCGLRLCLQGEAMAGAIGPLLRAAPGALRCDAAMAEACEHAWQVAAAARQGGPLYKRMFGLFALCGDYPFPRAAGRVPVATLAGGVQAGGGLSQEPSPLQDMQLSRRIGESLEVAWRDTRGPSLPSSAAVDGEPLCVSGPSDPCHVTITHSCDSASKAVQITVKVFNILDFELKYVSLRIGTVGPLVFAQHACQPSHVTHLPPLLPQDSFTTTFSFRVLAFQASTIFLQVIHRSTPPPLEEGDDSDAAGDNDANGMIDDSPLLNADASPSLGPTSSMPSLPGATSVVLHHCLPYPIPLAQLVEPLACSQEDFFRRWESFPAAISFSLAGLLSGPPTHGDIRSGPPGAAGAGATGSLGEPQGAWLAPIGPDSLRSSGGLLAPAGSATMGSTRRSGGGRLSGSVDVLARSSADRLYWEKGGWGGGAVAPRSSSSWSHRSRRATWRSWARTRSSRRVASRCASSAGPGSVTRSGWSWLATWQVTLERPCPSMPRFPSPPPRRPLRVWLRCQSPGSASSVKRSSGRPQRAQCRRCASSPRCGSRISLGA
eukprot:jgi/Mesvir1/5918/Mv00688-RA.1